MDINFWAILVCGAFSMALGMVWYGPLFGKRWMKVIGATEMDRQKREEMRRSAGPLYFATLLLALFQAYVLSWLIGMLPGVHPVSVALWSFAAFIVPTVASGAMWNNDSAKVSWARFLIQSGYYLVLFVGFGLILGYWR